MLRAIGGAALLLILALSLAQARPTPTPGHHDRNADEIFRRQELSRGVYVLYGGGGNVGFLVGPDAVLVVDSQVRQLGPGVVQQIQGATDKPIRYLLNTHHHGDHTGGNDAFRQFAVIIAHDNVRKRMREAPQTILTEWPAELEEAKKKGDAESVAYIDDAIAWAKKIKIEEIAAPVITFESEVRIHIGDETIAIWHTPPAHTDGDSVVYFEKANVLHMGDLFFYKVIPFIDVKAGGSARGYLDAIDKVIARVPPDVKIIPGHGEVTDLAGLKTFRQYVADILDAARKAKAAGKSKEEFLKTVDLPAYKTWDGYGERFQESAAAAWDEAS